MVTDAVTGTWLLLVDVFVWLLTDVNMNYHMFVCLLLQLLKRPVSGVRRMAAHPVLPYCKH